MAVFYYTNNILVYDIDNKSIIFEKSYPEISNISHITFPSDSVIIISTNSETITVKSSNGEIIN